MALTLARTMVIGFGNVCKKETQHQIRRCGETAVSICVPCWRESSRRTRPGTPFLDLVRDIGAVTESW